MTKDALEHLCECGLLSRVQLIVSRWTVARQAPLSMGFPRQEYWSGLPFPSPLEQLQILVKDITRGD